MSTARKAPPTSQAPHPHVLVVPRRWLIALTVLAVVPWLVMAAVHWWPVDAEATRDAPSANAQPAMAAGSGPWGTLDVTPMTISPPLEMISDSWGRADGAGKQWYFPSTTPEAARAFLTSAGLAPAQVADLMATARSDAGINGIVLTPNDDLLLALPPAVRSSVYTQLARSLLNADQAQAFRFADGSIDTWLGPSLISPETRKLVEPLVYRQNQHRVFADKELVLSRISDPEERRRLAKTLMRQRTFRLRLAIATPSEVPGLVAYWGRGGRRTDIKPLIESIVGAGHDGTVDIVHLLPSFVREHLYRYPRVTAQDLNRPALANCLWTALNFFSGVADDRYLEPSFSIERLQRDYHLVASNYELGDIVALVDEHGTIFHAAVYLADNYVFTKNGMSAMAPWVILPLDMVVDDYRNRSEKPRLLYHRRNDF